jgi:hypothetical protein
MDGFAPDSPVRVKRAHCSGKHQSLFSSPETPYLHLEVKNTMKRYYLIGGTVTFIVIFNLGYVFHELLMGQFFKDTIGPISREQYIIPVIALAFIIYTFIQAYFLHIFYTFARTEYRWILSMFYRKFVPDK